jgi:hypothetical protein
VKSPRPAIRTPINKKYDPFFSMIPPLLQKMPVGQS